MQAATTWFNRIAAGGLVLVGIAVIATGILIGMIAWSPTPIWDQWDAAAPEQLRQIFNAHNEHRIAMSRLIFQMDIAMARGTGVVNLVFVYLFSAAHVALLVLLARWTWPKASVTQLVAAAAIVSAFFFSGFQYENFASGFQNQFTGVFLFASSAIGSLCVAAGREDHWRQILIFFSALSTVVGVLSMANGLLIAPLLVVIALLLGLRATAWIMALIAVSSWFLYFRDYPSSSGPGLLSQLTGDPLGFVGNVLAYVGGAAPNSITAFNEPFAQKVMLARAFGAVTMLAVGALVIVTLWRPLKERPRYAVWAGIGVFVFASAAVTALGRSSFGDVAMLASRYGAGTAALWAVLAIWAVMPARGPVLSASLVATGALSLLLVAAQIPWIGAAQDYKSRRLDAEAALLSNADAPAAYLGVYPAPDRAPTIARSLRSKWLAMYYEPWRRIFGQKIVGADAVCAGQVHDVIALAGASEPTWRAAASGDLPPDTRGIAVMTPQNDVVGTFIRGGTGDINSTLFGADDAPPRWTGYIHLKAPRAVELSLQAVNVSGYAICRLDKTIRLDPADSVKLVAQRSVGVPIALAGEAMIKGAFPLDGFNAAVGPNPWGGRTWGSWGGDDKNTGVVTIAANVEGVDKVAIPVVTGPTATGSRIEVRVDGAVVKRLPAPVDVLRWSAIEIAVPPGSKLLEVIAEDASSAWGGWMAIGEPHAMCAGRCQERACPQTFIHGEIVNGVSGGVVDRITKDGGRLVVSGWAGDTNAKDAVDHVIAVADNNTIVACFRPDRPRPDVASANGVPALANSGFSLTVPAPVKGALVLYSRQADGTLAKLNGQ